MYSNNSAYVLYSAEEIKKVCKIITMVRNDISMAEDNSVEYQKKMYVLMTLEDNPIKNYKKKAIQK